MSAMKIKAGSEHEKERNKNTKCFKFLLVDCARDDCNCRDCAVRIGDDACGADAPRHPARQIGVSNRFLVIASLHASQSVQAPCLADRLYMPFFRFFFEIRSVSIPLWSPNSEAIISNPIQCGNRQKRFSKGVWLSATFDGREQAFAPRNTPAFAGHGSDCRNKRFAKQAATMPQTIVFNAEKQRRDWGLGEVCGYGRFWKSDLRDKRDLRDTRDKSMSNRRTGNLTALRPIPVLF